MSWLAIFYVSYGAGFYAGAAICRMKMFRDTTKMGVLRGVLLMAVWPIVLPALWYTVAHEEA